MLKWIETTGRNEEIAIEVALKQLGLGRDDVSVEVISRAKTGFLGIGSAPAKVKVSYEGPDEEVKVEESAVEKTVTPVVKAEKTEKAEKPEKPAGAKVDADYETEIRNFLDGLMKQMDMKVTAEIEVAVDGTYKVDLVGENLGSLIGRRGETLDAIQQLTSYTVNRGQSKRCRIHMDAENYRAKREETLIQLANKVADKVVKQRRNQSLEPMNAYERHIIHTALQDNNTVETFSTGTEPNRRIVVTCAKD